MHYSLEVLNSSNRILGRSRNQDLRTVLSQLDSHFTIGLNFVGIYSD